MCVLGEKSFFQLDDERQKRCVLIIDEVYVKSILQYHAGIVFGKTVNKPSKLAYTVLSFMFVDLAVLNCYAECFL